MLAAGGTGEQTNQGQSCALRQGGQAPGQAIGWLMTNWTSAACQTRHPCHSRRCNVCIVCRQHLIVPSVLITSACQVACVGFCAAAQQYTRAAAQVMRRPFARNLVILFCLSKYPLSPSCGRKRPLGRVAGTRDAGVQASQPTRHRSAKNAGLDAPPRLLILCTPLFFALLRFCFGSSSLSESWSDCSGCCAAAAGGAAPFAAAAPVG